MHSTKTVNSADAVTGHSVPVIMTRCYCCVDYNRIIGVLMPFTQLALTMLDGARHHDPFLRSAVSFLCPSTRALQSFAAQHFNLAFHLCLFTPFSFSLPGNVTAFPQLYILPHDEPLNSKLVTSDVEPWPLHCEL